METPRLTLNHTPPIVPEEDWKVRLKRTHQLVREVSRMAGREIPILPVDSSADITGAPGVYLLVPRRREAAIKRTDFELQPKLLSGIADSAHAVLAGDLKIEYDKHNGASGFTEVREVAAKCFYKREPQDRLHRALTETRFMEELSNRGELTMLPVAVAITPENSRAEGSVTIVTEYNPTLISLDNLPWGRGLTGHNSLRSLQAVRALAEFNTQGILHGDAKIKNVAQDQVGRIGMIDYETSRRIDPELPTDAGEAAYLDFGQLLGSFYDKGFLKPNSSASTNFANLLAEEYLGAWKDSSPAVQEAVYDGLLGSLSNAAMTRTVSPAQ